MTTHEANENAVIQTPAVHILQVNGEPNAEPTKRTRRSLGRGEPPDRRPEVIEGEEFGKAFVRVEVFGRITEQELTKEHRFMTLDAEDWPRVRELTPWWSITTDGDRFFSIARGKTDLAGFAKQSDDSRPNLLLSRFIMGAVTGQIVRTPPGNPLDLRKANLELVEDKTAWRASRAVQKQFKDHLDSNGV
jgi:hypothetical protein